MQQQPGTQPPALALHSTLLHRYSIDGYIGGGGFGYIYLATDLFLGHRRAIKEAVCKDANAEHQFRLEAEFLLNARHPNLVRAYAVFEHAGRLYLVMDYVDGQTLEDIAIQHIRQTGRTVAEAQVLDWVIPICDAAHELHAQPLPIIHRDIKPANIKLRSSDKTPILIDLGLAKLFMQGTQTIQAALAFTPGYAPPEQYQASGATDQRTDVYGLGATLFYLLTGYQPTEAPARLAAQALPQPRALNPALSARSEAIVLKAMALDPADRFQSAREMELELRAARTALAAGAARPTGPLARVSAPIEPAASVPCPYCGTANPAIARFCMRCGSPMRSTSAPQSARGARGGTSPVPVPLGAANGNGRRAEARQRPPAPRGVVPMRRDGWQPVPAGMAGAARLEPILPHPIAALLRSAEQAWPFAGSRAQVRRVAQRALDLAASPNELEAWTGFCSWLAAVCVSLSLTAIVVRVMLLLVLPGLALGHWCWAQPPGRSPREFRWLAQGALIAGYAWLALWVLVWLHSVV